MLSTFFTFRYGSASSVQVDMQIEAAARLKSTLFDLSALEISRNISFGAPPPIFRSEVISFPNDLRGGFRKLKEQGVGNRRFGAGPVPKSLLLLLLLLMRTPPPPGTRFYLHKETEKSKSAWYGFTRSKCDSLTLLWPTCRTFFQNESRGR